MNVGQAIRANRVRLQLSQGELAERIGVSQKAISKYEVNKAVPPADNLSALADVFGVTVDSLLGKEEQEQTDICTVFLENVIALIKENGITKNKLLSDLGLSRNSFVDWRTRGTVPSASTARAIAKYFGVTLNQLFGMDDGSGAEEPRKRQAFQISFEGALTISDRKYRISLSIAPQGKEVNE